MQTLWPLVYHLEKNSRQRSCEIIATTSLNNSILFIKSIKNAIEHRVEPLMINEKKFIITWDNVFLHISKETKNFIANIKVIICTITPYSACFNSTGQMSLYIK